MTTWRLIRGDGRNFIHWPERCWPTFTDNDIAFGGENRDVLMGGGGDDQALGCDHRQRQRSGRGRQPGEYGELGPSNELDGDTLNGSKKGDVLFGGTGQTSPRAAQATT